MAQTQCSSWGVQIACGASTNKTYEKITKKSYWSLSLSRKKITILAILVTWENTVFCMILTIKNDFWADWDLRETLRISKVWIVSHETKGFQKKESSWKSKKKIDPKKF